MPFIGDKKGISIRGDISLGPLTRCKKPTFKRGSSCDTNSMMAAGGVFRDASGKWITGFAGYIGVGSALQAEIWALYWGLSIANTAGYSALFIESDSLALIRLIKEKDWRFHPQANLLLECRHFLDQAPQ